MSRRVLLVAALIVLLGVGIALYGASEQVSHGTTIARPDSDCTDAPAARIILVATLPTPGPDTLSLALPEPVLVEPTRCAH